MSIIVIDASALAEVLLDTADGRRLAERLDPAVDELHAPHLIAVEVLSVIRGWAAAGAIDESVAARAIDDLVRFPLHLWDERPFLDAAWGLRHNVSTYDAQYVVLAKALDAPLLTGDRRLARAAASLCRVAAP